MKIVHIITRLIVGGAQENTLLSVKGQMDLGEEVVLVSGPAEGPEGDLFEQARDWGVRVVMVPELIRAVRPATDWRAYVALRRVLRSERPEVAHTHSSKAGILGRAAAWAERVPAVVHTIHGLPFGPFQPALVNRGYIALERWAARRCHAIVGVCQAMNQQALAAGIGRPEQYHVIYSGMDVDRFLNPPGDPAATRQRLGLEPGTVAFATVARLFELKGHDDLLDVAPEVLRRDPRVRFVFVGDGCWRERLQAKARRLGVAEAIRWVGLVRPDEIPPLLAACDVVVHPSLREGLARVLPQGLIAGKPAISYDIDGAREVVTPETGILLKPRDLAGLTQAILDLAADPERRARLGAAGRNRFAEQFRWETMVHQLHDLYRRILDRPA
ncbi:glycosyl transferase group 1 [Isosphaera pallida ATCC 43644]|uniref:Glycosyl transferase group 1 n=1 Tax=Isosphaera pallida (strain ATCC 43644 / DSM 9630 / IS1B) TaxID=575540 RepID=E8QZJ8_ISOPI|nr:glycosyltransferase family 4 protein [Isosphaera pallida]ADV61125.1 glycosyl transferase group 1 [Isosphaera pallida ATCC 43644]